LSFGGHCRKRKCQKPEDGRFVNKPNGRSGIKLAAPGIPQKAKNAELSTDINSAFILFTGNRIASLSGMAHGGAVTRHC